MRKVYATAASEKETQGQKQLRAIFEKNPGQFLSMMRAEEKAHREAKKEKLGFRVGEMDEGTERCLELVEGLLVESKEKGEW